MNLLHAFHIYFVLPTLHHLVSSASQNKGAFHESFIINLRKIKHEI